MSDVVQLNTRIDRELKASGDEALSLIGLNPSQAIRALWEKAARRGKDLEEVAELLSSVTRRGPKAEANEAEDVVRQGWDFMENAYALLGIDPAVTRDYPPDDELLEDALYERLVERGLA